MRLNAERVSMLSSDNPERARLFDLAEGMRVPLPNGFVPNGQQIWPRHRARYLKAASAVNKMLMTTHDRRLAFVLPKDIARTIPGLHISPAHWTTKKGKPQGRNLLDSTDPTRGALNDGFVRDCVEKLYDPIHHPTIAELVTHILDYFDQLHEIDPSLTWDDFLLYKMDLQSAFNLISFRPEAVPLFATELTDDIVIIFLCGIFGWTGTPFAFDVVTRAIRHELRRDVKGCSDMYVDDVMGFCLRALHRANIATTDSICRSLLGPDAIAPEKTETSIDTGLNRLDWIGYTICLNSLTVTISRKNFLKTVYGFFGVNIEAAVPVRQLETLASWASRYAIILCWLRPFTRFLYGSFKGLPRNKSVELDGSARITVRLWRAALCALACDETRFARPLRAFQLDSRKKEKSFPATVVVEFDASLWGAGVLVFARSTDGSETLLGGSAASFATLNFTTPAMQNTAEFIAIIMGVVTLRRLGRYDKAIGFRGDSVTALKWAESESFSGVTVTNAAIVFVLMFTSLRLEVARVDHISAELNDRCDYLSRNSIEARLSDIGLKGTRQISLNSDGLVADILQLCNPDTTISTEKDFQVFWKRAHECIAAL